MRMYSRYLVTGVALAMLALHTAPAIGAPPEFPGAKGQPFQALQSQIDDINTDVAGLQAQIDSINIQIATLQADIASLQSQIDANAGDIATLQSQQASNSLALASLQATAAGLQSQINFLNATKQNNVTGFCPPQSSIRVILPNGQVLCEFDDGEARTTVVSGTIGIPPNAIGSQGISCPPNFFVTGGGYAIGAPGGVDVIANLPPNPTAWFAQARNFNPFTVGLTVFANCALSQ